MTATTGLVIDHATHTIRFTRSFDAPPALVFSAWTDAEQLRCWWDPTGEKLTICEIDLRPGGSFCFAACDHGAHPFTGTYREIDPPNRLVFEAMQSLGRVLLEGAGGGTRMIVEIECGSPEQLEQFIQMGVAKGTAQTLDNLVAFIKRDAA